MKKRLLTLFLALLSCILIFSSCDGTPAETSHIAEITAEETQSYDDGIVLFAPGVCEYRIVYPSDETDAEFNAARKLQSLIEEKCGVKVEIVRSTQACGEK